MKNELCHRCRWVEGEYVGERRMVCVCGGSSGRPRNGAVNTEGIWPREWTLSTSTRAKTPVFVYQRLKIVFLIVLVFTFQLVFTLVFILQLVFILLVLILQLVCILVCIHKLVFIFQLVFMLVSIFQSVIILLFKLAFILVFIFQLLFILQLLFLLVFILKLVFIFQLVFMLILSPYVHVIKVLSTTAGYGISRDQSKRSYEVERSFGATGFLEFSTSTQKRIKGGGKKVEPILG
jgi:hypothetical protein